MFLLFVFFVFRVSGFSLFIAYLDGFEYTVWRFSLSYIKLDSSLMKFKSSFSLLSVEFD